MYSKWEAVQDVFHFGLEVIGEILILTIYAAVVMLVAYAILVICLLIAGLTIKNPDPAIGVGLAILFVLINGFFLQWRKRS